MVDDKIKIVTNIGIIIVIKSVIKTMNASETT